MAAEVAFRHARVPLMVSFVLAFLLVMLPSCSRGSAYGYGFARVESAAPPSQDQALYGEAVDDGSDAESSDAIGGSGDSPSLERPAFFAAAANKSVGSPGSSAKGGVSGSTEPAVSSDVAPVQQVLIYTALLHMTVFEVEKSIGEVEAVALKLGGFVSRKTVDSIIVRVPAERFDESVKEISGMGDVLDRDVVVQDITEEFLDITLRLRNARAVRDRIAALLPAAKTVEDSINIEKELHRLGAEIERLEGRLRFLSSRVRYSTITVRFATNRSMEHRTTFRLPFPWLERLGLGRLLDLN